MRKIISLFFLLPSIALGASQGPRYATSCVNDATFGTNPWVNPGNACAEDAAVSTESGTSQYLQATGFGFSIPASATILGILVEVKKQATSGQLVLDNSVRLYINGVVSGNNKALALDWIDTGLTYYSYGGSSDTWGLTLTGADVNNANFGVAFSCQKDGGGTQTGNLDADRITVFYAAGPTTINSGTIYNGTIR